MFKKGYTPWNKGKKGYINKGSFKKGQVPWIKGKHHSETSKIKASQKKKGKHYSPATEFKKGLIPYSKLHPEIMPRGKRHYNWKGGKTKTIKGYIWIYFPEHPCANHGYIYEHRFIIEKILKRYLLPYEEIHHLGAKDDNRPHMLMAFISTRAHRKFELGKSIKPEEIIFDGRKL